MACLFILVFPNSSIAKSAKNTSAYLETSARIMVGALFHCRVAIGAIYDKEINALAFSAIMYITKVLEFLFNTILANSFLLISFIKLVVVKGFEII